MPVTVKRLCDASVRMYKVPDDVSFNTEWYEPAMVVELTSNEGVLVSRTVTHATMKNPPQTVLLESLYHKHVTLEPGRMYYFKEHYFYMKSPLLKGLFVKHVVTKTGRQFSEFVRDCKNFQVTDKVPSLTLKVRPVFMSNLMRKQVGRGLCDNGLPEDCAGVVERMLVENTVVRKGPDRYPARV